MKIFSLDTNFTLKLLSMFLHTKKQTRNWKLNK